MLRKITHCVRDSIDKNLAQGNKESRKPKHFSKIKQAISIIYFRKMQRFKAHKLSKDIAMTQPQVNSPPFTIDSTSVKYLS